MGAVVFPELGVNRFLAPSATTTVELPTDRPGSFEFACGMNMLHGTLVIEGESTAPETSPTAPRAVLAGDAVDLDAEATAHRDEVADLARPVSLGA